MTYTLKGNNDEYLNKFIKATTFSLISVTFVMMFNKNELIFEIIFFTNLSFKR